MDTDTVEYDETEPTTDLSRGYMVSDHFLGRVVPISLVLATLASGENCDGEPYDTMVIAARYIDSLETEIAELQRVAQAREREREREGLGG